MRFHQGERRVTLSVGEFSEFRQGPSLATRGYSPWRAAIGTAWHDSVRKQVSSHSPDTRFEVPLQGTWIEKGWRIELQGRADQWQEQDGRFLIREIKTISAKLPLAEEELFNRYPDYFAQLATYLVLAALDPAVASKQLEGELYFVDYRSGISQSVPLPLAPQKLFQERLDALVPFLETKWNSRLRLRDLSFNPPFPTWRPEQTEAIEHLHHAFRKQPTVLFEAPTGFGKTGTVLYLALEKLSQGECQRVIILSSKSTGQHQIIRQLQGMLPQSPTIRFLQFRNRREHAIQSPLHTCETGMACELDDPDRWNRAGVDLESLFTQGTVSLEQIRMLGATLGICPYLLSKALLPLAEIWICDANYVFGPGNRHIFDYVPGFDPAQTFLIVDEAHNLPQRIADHYSFSESSSGIEGICQSLSWHGFPSPFKRAYEQYLEFIQTLPPKDRHDPSVLYELRDLLGQLKDRLLMAAPEHDELEPFLREQLWQIPARHSILESNELNLLPWSPRKGHLNVSCLDAGNAARRELTSYGQTLLMSATLSPPGIMSEALGFPSNTAPPFIQAEADWRNEAYRMAVDCRVDTRLKTRASYYEKTAQTVSSLCQNTAAPVVVFFPSYQYAETIRTYLEAVDPLLRTAIQPRSIDLNGQLGFLEESLLTCHALFFILGSSFSESIDLLGGRVETAMVVGPALPEVNPVQKAIAQGYESLGRAESFRRTYQIPAMRKINQALGRLVRAPGQKADILLHCRRFAEQSYRSLLAPEYQTPEILPSDEAFINWAMGRHAG